MEKPAGQDSWNLAQSTELSETIKKTTTTTTNGDTTSRVELLQASRVQALDQEQSMAASRQAEMKQLHVTALDQLVSVNSSFTAAVFIGLSFNAQSTSLVSTCMVGQDVAKQLVIFEVISFSCFLFSTLIAQGLKYQMTLSSLKFTPLHHHHHLSSNMPLLPLRAASATTASRPTSSMHVHHINPDLLRFGMMLSAVGSIVGTIFLMLAMVNVIQIRLGLIGCSGSWTKHAVYPLLTLVSTGVLTFISPVIYSVITYK